MGILLIFFVVCTLVLIVENNNNQPSTLYIYIPFYITGIILISLLAFLGIINPYYVVVMVLMPLPNILVVAAILHIWDAIAKTYKTSSQSVKPDSSNQAITSDEYLTQARSLMEKAEDLKKIATSLKREYQRLKKLAPSKLSQGNRQALATYYKTHTQDIKHLLVHVGYCDKVQVQYQVELEQIIRFSPKYHPEFDQTEVILKNTLHSFKSLEQDLTDWLDQTQQKKDTLNQQCQWDAYEQKTKAFTEQKKQVIATQKAYNKVKIQLQTSRQHLGKDQGLNTKKPVDLDNLAAYLQLQKNSLVLGKLQDLQTKALQLKQRLQKEKQTLRAQGTQVDEQWLEYQKLYKDKTGDLALWASYNEQNEEAFWGYYEYVITQIKNTRTAAIQKAGS
ncbi:hypothetical protein BKI52_44165 [marine bacterium AO1-C]|nr:hypothetical protein BKI52_44165 [marine bacterium AO1-C]